MLMQFKQFSEGSWVFFFKAEKMYLNKEICLIPYCVWNTLITFVSSFLKTMNIKIENFHKSKFNLAKQSENVK